MVLSARPSAGASAPKAIVSPIDASYAESLAAQEARRYVYLRTGHLLPITSNPGGGASIFVMRKDRRLPANVADSALRADLEKLGAQSFRVKSTSKGDLVVVGGDDSGTLYGAYRLAELMGVRFYLHGDVIPDQHGTWPLPPTDDQGSPLFPLRGIQPFHDFPEGPDWWNRDDYLAILGQLPKLRMNFFGLHTYPENRPNAEPTVWIGLPQDVGQGRRPAFSYPASYQNTQRGNWGYAPMKTSEFPFGSAMLFERDAYGADVMAGMIPAPQTTNECNDLFERTAVLLNDAFSFAHRLGIKTCAGTETPLVVPKVVQDRIASIEGGTLVAEGTKATRQALYEGIFRRVTQAYPLDYYWFWTPEDWTWSGVKPEQVQATLNDLNAATAAWEKVRPPFKLATCGWVLGPQQDRALFDKALPKDFALSCINREVGYTPVDPGFAEVKGRSKWAIPWLEDDPALTAPQLWVGRMRRDAADSLRYGCDGLIGIHWRTRVLGPNIGALAQAGWSQTQWLPAYEQAQINAQTQHVAGPVGGQIASFPNTTIGGTSDDTIYQTVRYGMSAYYLPLTNGLVTITLKFCEPHFEMVGQRVFGIKIQGRTVLPKLDIIKEAGINRALDYSFPNVLITNGWLEISFIPQVELPSIAGIEIGGDQYVYKVNCGGPEYKDFQADLGPGSQPIVALPPSSDFYQDWATHEFGAEVGSRAAAILSTLDGKLPKPATWVNGPGGHQSDSRPWDTVRAEYAFVDDFAALRSAVKGPGNLERFDYWLNTFEYFRSMGRLNCAWGEYNRAMAKVKAEQDPGKKKQLAQQQAVPARRQILSVLRELYSSLLAAVSTTGELGTVANWSQHNLPELLTKPGQELASILGELPADLQPETTYKGPLQLIVPTKRTLMTADEDFTLKVTILAAESPRAASLHWRKLGTGRFIEVPLRHLERGVYEVSLPKEQKADFEYYLSAKPASGPAVLWPKTAPNLNQTVVVTGAP